MRVVLESLLNGEPEPDTARVKKVVAWQTGGCTKFVITFKHGFVARGEHFAKSH